VGWKDEASHRLRFEKLIQVIKPQRKEENITVNDFGCGYGAMFNYLNEILGPNLVKYYGYDVSEEMITAARKFINDPRAEFIESLKVTHLADYSFISGTFNVKLKASDAMWTEYVKETLINAAGMSRKGFSFNALSVYVDWKEENLYYADPFLFFDFCKRKFSRYVALLHDYPLFEWTMIVYKEDPSG
jgi:SAM-dependent methyltransferase